MFGHFLVLNRACTRWNSKLARPGSGSEQSTLPTLIWPLYSSISKYLLSLASISVDRVHDDIAVATP